MRVRASTAYCDHGAPAAAILRARLDHARLLYDEHVAPRIVTIGGSRPGDVFTEANVGVIYLERTGER